MPKFTSETAGAAGRRGGQSAQAARKGHQITAETARSYGQRGGTATVRRYGHAHMATIGAQGFATTCQRYYGGDRAAYAAELRERGLLVACDREFALLLTTGIYDHLRDPQGSQ